MINIALIGCGKWGKNYTNALQNIEEVNLSWVYNKSNDPMIELPADTGFTKDYHRILDDKRVDAVIISTPPGTHYRYSREALEAGKDVLVEKPMTLNSADSREIADLADKGKRILMVGHLFLYNPAIIELKKFVKNGELGEVLYFNSQRTGKGPFRSDISVMWDQAVHDISVLNFLKNDTPIKITARGISFLNNNIEDVVALDMEYSDGSRGLVYASWYEPEKIRKTTIVGSKKTVIFDDCSKAKLRVFDNIDIEKPPLSLDPGCISPLENQCIQFVKSIKAREKPISDGHLGHSIVQILEHAQKSLETGASIEVRL